MRALPNELVKLISDNLESHRDAANMSRVCKRFYALADMSTRQKHSRVRLRETQQLQAAFNMLLLILRKPYLGTYLRHIELDLGPKNLNHHLWPPNPPSRITLKPQDLRSLAQAIARIGLQEPTEDRAMLEVLLNDPASMEINDTRGPYAQALVTLLVSVSPNL
ncbi:hypothetical protein BJX64DRAFT_263043 [Aspergillus heterothallicus]